MNWAGQKIISPQKKNERKKERQINRQQQNLQMNSLCFCMVKWKHKAWNRGLGRSQFLLTRE